MAIYVSIHKIFSTPYTEGKITELNKNEFEMNEMEDFHGLMEENTRENLKTVYFQVMVNIYGLMVGSMKAIIRKISKKFSELIRTPRVQGTKVIGKTGFNTAAEKLSNRLAKKMEVFGSRDKKETAKTKMK